MNLPKLLHATRWINLLERDGWIFASRRRPEEPSRIDGVNVVALHRASPADVCHRLVVIEEFRVPIDRWEFGMPAGLLDAGEAVETCAERELKEETGLEVATVLQRSGTTFSSPGLCDESQAFVVATCCGTPSLEPGIDGERIRVHLLSRQDCRELLERNRLEQAAISSRLWPVLVAVAQGGSFAGVAITE